jgi:hypothetical protein
MLPGFSAEAGIYRSSKSYVTTSFTPSRPRMAMELQQGDWDYEWCVRNCELSFDACMDWVEEYWCAYGDERECAWERLGCWDFWFGCTAGC